MLRTCNAKTVEGEPVRLWIEDLGRVMRKDYKFVLRIRFSKDGVNFIESDTPCSSKIPRRFGKQHLEELSRSGKNDIEALKSIGVVFDSIDFDSVERVES